MAILAGDIKLVASQVMLDVPEGGGAPTPTIIEDAVSNAIFPDISELDRAGGRVNLRKLFANIQTLNTDGYFGGNVIVAEPPSDPLVSITLFTTRDTFDRRTSAASRIESYLNAGPASAALLYENHIVGQRSIQLFARTNVTPPPPGRTVLLRWHEGLSDEREQYVRITRVASEERTFTYNGDQDYQAQIITCDISDPLRFDFPGTAANRSFAIETGKTILRDTVVADAAVYYGIVPLADAVDIGDIDVVADSVYTQLVPNARTETSVLDQRPSGEAIVFLADTPRVVGVQGSPLSQRIKIGQENRGFNYVTILTPLPKPDTLKVQYRALGQWYTISDNGDGTMSGSGSGTVNYVTGSVSVTLDALPDDRSAVVFYWGQAANYTDRAGTAGFRAPEYAFQLDHTGVEPGTVVITWTSGAVVKTATDDGSGKLTGHATGEVAYATGMVYIRPTAMLDPGGEFDIEFEWSSEITETKTGLSPDGAGAVTFSVASTPVAGTIRVQWLTTREHSVTGGSSSAAGSSTKSGNTESTVLFAPVTSSILVPDYFDSLAYVENNDLGTWVGDRPR